MAVNNMEPSATEIRNPCDPNPSGFNTECRVINGKHLCSCFKNHCPNPYTYCGEDDAFSGKHNSLTICN